MSDFDTTGLVKYEDSDEIPSKASLSYYSGMATGVDITGSAIIIVGFLFGLGLALTVIGFVLIILGITGFLVERFFYRKYYVVVHQGRVVDFGLFGKRVRIRGYTRANELATGWVRVSKTAFKNADFKTLIDLR